MLKIGLLGQLTTKLQLLDVDVEGPFLFRVKTIQQAHTEKNFKVISQYVVKKKIRFLPLGDFYHSLNRHTGEDTKFSFQIFLRSYTLDCLVVVTHISFVMRRSVSQLSTSCLSTLGSHMLV